MGEDKKNQFIPKPGQVDYTHVRWTPVINCVVRFKNSILLVQRSEKVNFYPGYWNGISGFLDDAKGMEEKVKEELKEELDISSDQIKEIQAGRIFHQDEPKYKKTWIVHPVLVDVDTDRVCLNGEGKTYQWVKYGDMKDFCLLPGFDKVLRALSRLLK